ncbi:hypothetical protein CapIbe_005475 [Capra ibex]
MAEGSIGFLLMKGHRLIHQETNTEEEGAGAEAALIAETDILNNLKQQSERKQTTPRKTDAACWLQLSWLTGVWDSLSVCTEGH